MKKFIILLANSQHYFIHVMRIVLFIVMVWLGGLKTFSCKGTCLFSNGLGIVMVVIGTMTLLGIWLYKIGLIGGLLTFVISLITLSFLITMPETFVSDLGGEFSTPHHGFPYLSGLGQLVIKDAVMMTAGLICAADCAKQLFRAHILGMAKV